MKTLLLTTLIAGMLCAPAAFAQTIPAKTRKLVKSSDPAKCIQGLNQLRNLAGPKVDALLLDRAHRHRELWVRDHALEILMNRGKSPATLDWMGAQLGRKRTRKDAIVPVLLLKVLGNVGRPAAGAVPAMAPLLGHRDPQLRGLAAWAVGRTFAPPGFPFLTARLPGEKDPRVRGLIADALSRCGGARAVEPLLGLCGEADYRTAVPALRALRYADKSKSREKVLRACAALAQAGKPRPLRFQVVENCLWLKRRGSIPPLLEILGTGKGLLQRAARDALVTLTGKKYGIDLRSWQHWWQTEGRTFRPDWKAIKKRERGDGPAHAADRTWGYYHGHKVTSDRIVFLIDGSGSMRQPHGTDKRTRFQHAVSALEQLMAKMPPSTEFSIILFSAIPIPWERSLQKATKEAKDKALKFLRLYNPRGLTNMLDALVMAMRIGGADTIYLLSDGAPSAGEHRYRRPLLDKVERENLSAKVRIHTINFGGNKRNKDLLRALAERHGGQSR